MSLRYLLDEHVAYVLQSKLLRREPLLAVWHVGDAGAPSYGTLDPDIVKWCERNDFILVTSNRRTMPQHLMDHVAKGGHARGVFILKPGMSETVDELIVIAGTTVPGEHQNLVRFLPIS